MTRVLIPFVEPDGAERAVRDFLGRSGEVGRNSEVELLAIVEPLHTETARHACSEAVARQIARESASVWFARVAPLLAGASIPYRTAVAVGDRREQIERALLRQDIDRVLLPQATSRLRRPSRPVNVVA